MRKAGPAKLFSLSTRLPAEQILSQSSDLILILDESYTIRELSDSFLFAFGISKDDLINLNISSTVIGPGLIDRIRDPVRQAMAGNGSVVNAWIPVQKEWRAFRIRIIPLVFGWGDKGIVVILEDRTMEVMAQEENALLADMLNTSPASITVFDFDGNFLYSNERNLELHGYSAGEFLKLNLNDIDNPESQNLLPGRLMDIRRTGESSCEVVHFHKDGRQIPLEVRSKVTRWGNRDVIISVATDISGRKQAERALKESERRFADIINFLPDATFVVNSEGTIISWNRAMEEMTGVIAGDIVGKGDNAYGIALYGEQHPTLLDLIVRDNPEVRNLYRHLRKEGSTFTAETILATPGGGERVLWLKTSPFYNRDGRITGAIESIRDITEWRRLEEELRHNYDLLSQKEQVLRESEETFRAMVEQSGDGIIIVDFSGIVQFANSRAWDIINYPHDRRTTGTFNVFEIISPELRENVVRDFLQVSRGIDSYEVQYKIFTFDKKARWVACIGKRISFKGSLAMLLSFRDVTGRKRAEEELRESEKKFATVFQRNPISLTLVSAADGVFVDVNDAFLRNTGYARTDVIGKTAEDLGIFADKNVYAQMLSLLRDQHPVHNRELRCRIKTGTIRTCLFSSGVITMGGKPHILSTIEDITERKNTEDAVRESGERYRLILKNAHDGILVNELTPKGPGKFIDANDQACRILGMTHEEMQDVCLVDLDTPEMRARAPEIFQEIIKNNHTVFQTNYRTKDYREKILDISVSLFDLKGRPTMLSVVRDITERKAAESAFQAMVTSMVGTTGMESLDRITESIGAWLGADCVMIGEITPDRERVQVLSMLLDGKKIPDFSYTLKGTPCENTAEKGFCIYPDEVARLFPESRDLREFNIRGYAGTPLRNFEGQVVGTLCILTRNPLNLPPSAREIINIIAVKASAEIGFKNARKILHENEREVRTSFKSSS